MSAWDMTALTSWVPGQAAQSASRDKPELGGSNSWIQFDGMPKFSVPGIESSLSFIPLPDFLGGEGKGSASRKKNKELTLLRDMCGDYFSHHICHAGYSFEIDNQLVRMQFTKRKTNSI